MQISPISSASGSIAAIVSENNKKDILACFASIFNQQSLNEITWENLKHKQWKLAEIKLIHSYTSGPQIDDVSSRLLTLAIDSQLAAQFQLNAEKFGNKTANLYKLQSLLPLVPNKFNSHIKFEVPDFTALDSQQIINFLEEKISLNSLWKVFTQQQRDKTDGLSEGAVQTLETIQKYILEAFQDPQILQYENVKRWLNSDSDQLLMVRSTGREDTDKIANAGGNESIPARPTSASLLQAIGVVVASYFSKTSLQQRLSAGDDICTFPFCPVLIQKMISEQEGIPPVSGVIFTQEAEGETKGLTQIQAAPGHNELVVNGKGNFDTLYIDREFDIQHIVRPKYHRLTTKVQGSTCTFEVVLNNVQLEKKCALERKEAIRLKELSDTLEKAYGKPMDIEFVYMPREKTVYIVQARPLITATKKVPTHLFLTGKEATLAGVVVGSAGGQGLEVKDSINIICAKTLAEAHHTYFNHSNKKQIQAILTEEVAPSTSHEATEMRREKIPVIAMQNQFQETLEWLKQCIPLFLDTQRGVLVKSQVPVEIKEGWITHPIPKQISLPIVELSETKLERLHKLYQKLIRAAKQADAKWATAEIFDILKSENSGKAQAALGLYLRRLQSMSSINPNLFAQTILWANKVYKVFDREAYSISRLYPINVLEALWGQSVDHNVLYNSSLRNQIETDSEEKELARLIPKHLSLMQEHKERVIQYLKLGKAAFNDNIKHNWKTFIFTIVEKGSLEQQNQLAQLILDLQKFQLGHLWINQVFSPEEYIQDPQVYLKELMMQFDQNKTIFNYAEQLKVRIDYWQQKISAWGEEAPFESLYKKFKENFLDQFVYGELINKFKDKDTASLGKLLLLQIQRQAVQVFDQTIKSVSGSPHYKDKQLQVKRFAKLLDSYINFSADWVLLIKELFPEKELQLMVGNEAFKEDKVTSIHLFSGYLSEIRKLYQNYSAKPFLEQLQPSGRFAVASAQIGAMTDFKWHRPKNLEDIFTLVHQNLEQAGSIFTAIYGITQSQLPSFIRDGVIAGLPQIEKPARVLQTFQLVNIGYNYPVVSTTHNLSLRQHSLIVKFDYNIKNQETLCSLHCFGADEASRMSYTIPFYLDLASLTSDISYVIPPSYNKQTLELTAIWKLKSSLKEGLEQLKVMNNYLADIANISMGLMSSKRGYFDSLETSYDYFKDKFPSFLKQIEEGKFKRKDLSLRALQCIYYATSKVKPLTALEICIYSYKITRNDLNEFDYIHDFEEDRLLFIKECMNSTESSVKQASQDLVKELMREKVDSKEIAELSGLLPE
ncbi:MAG: hypothetical protein K0S74_1802 [Chlamydiales bacterium]|jgi:hypothetical protein|nr:hypothetical protein [Chlamydiales bacterium]